MIGSFVVVLVRVGFGNEEQVVFGGRFRVEYKIGGNVTKERKASRGRHKRQRRGA